MKAFIILLSTFILCLAGCSSTTEQSDMSKWMEKNGKVKVLCTTAIIEDLVAQIGGPHIDHISLIIGQMDPHSYELVKGDNEKISLAGLIFSHGLGLEHGASLHYQLQHHPNVVSLGDEIRKSTPEKILFVEGQLDPHVWMDISLWSGAVDPIVKALSEKDPAHATIYQENGKAVLQEMRAVHEELKEKIHQVPLEKRYLVTSHDAFHYFTQAYLGDDLSWQERCQAPEGLAPDGQLSTADIQRIIDHLFAHRIAVVFPESNVSKDALKKIVSSCAKKGLQVRISDQSLYGDAMGGVNSDANSYLGMIRHNVIVLIKEWSDERPQ
ncbi:MAG TPA: zinc ABC transporter substrate-binding protein [Rhabdochlamydiaceae bacterium]|nr:zinc ABC transporter substrate-binding protein [Rhabdochlamydiaceae bacterium]